MHVYGNMHLHGSEINIIEYTRRTNYVRLLDWKYWREADFEDNILNKFRIWKERHIDMRKPYQLPGCTKNASYCTECRGSNLRRLLQHLTL